jgi:hypothetical protein
MGGGLDLGCEQAVGGVTTTCAPISRARWRRSARLGSLVLTLNGLRAA